MVHIIGQKITTYCTLRNDKTLEMDFRDGRFNMIVMMLTVLLWILLCLKELGVTISDCCYIVSWKYFLFLSRDVLSGCMTLCVTKQSLM